MNSFCSKVAHSVSGAYHSLEAMQPGLGKGIAQVSTGASIAAAGAGALIFRTAVCYAAEKGMTCGNPLTMPVAIATLLVMGGGWTIRAGLQNITKAKIGDRTASAVLAADHVGQLLGRGNMGTHAKKAADDLQQAYQAGSELFSLMSSGASAVSNWWYGTPAETPPSSVQHE